MSLRLGELTAFASLDDSALDRGLIVSEAKVKAAGKTMARDLEVSGRQAGAGFHHGALPGVERFFRDADGRLHDERGRFVREFEQLGQAAGAAAAGGMSGLFSTVGEIGQAFASAGGPLKIFAIGLLIVVGAATLAGPAIGAVAAALAALPALALGAAASIATLIIGFSGIADHFKKTAKAGGAYVDRAYQIIQAERRIRDANAEVRASTIALTRAREDAARKLRDLALAAHGAQLDQREATLRLADAQKELERAQATGDADQIERAQLAYEQANQTLAEARTRTVDLSVERQRAAEVGVEGSDQVTSALDRQKHAVEGVQDAEHALEQTRRAGGGGSAQQLSKISKNAMELVATLKALKPAWDRLRLSVQDKLFAGASEEIKDLAKRWLPFLQTKLGNFASTFNGIFKTFSGTAQKPEFIERTGKALDTVDRLLDKVGGALAGPFAEAMSILGAAAAPIIDMLGDDISGFISDFADWIKSGEKSGKLSEFLTQAGGFLHDVMHLGGTVVGIIGDLTKAAFGAEDDGESSWQTFLKTLDDLKTWLDDPKNQKTVEEWIDRMQRVGIVFFKVTGFVLGLLVGLFEMEQKLKGWVERTTGKVGEFAGGVKKWLGQVVDHVKELPGKIATAAVGMWDGIKTAFKAAINWIIDRWNALKFTIPGIDVFGQAVGGTTLNMPQISHLKDGGLVPATAGGRVVRVAEAGQAEAVLPLSSLGPMLRDAVLQALEAAGGLVAGFVDVTLDLGEGIEQVVRIKLDRRDRQTKRQVGMARGR